MCELGQQEFSLEVSACQLLLGVPPFPGLQENLTITDPRPQLPMISAQSASVFASLLSTQAAMPRAPHCRLTSFHLGYDHKDSVAMEIHVLRFLVDVNSGDTSHASTVAPMCQLE